MKKLIIFDCDGVLVDSEYVSSCVFSEALASYGYQISVGETIKRFTGITEHEARQMIMNECKSIEIPENYWALQKPKLQEVYRNLNSLMHPVLEILSLLKIPKCIASNSPKSHVLNCLTHSGQSHYFLENQIFSAEQVKKPKPAPDLFLFAANQMGARPEDCLVIEDSRAGVEAAKEAGMEAFIFFGGTHARFDWYQSQFTHFEKPFFNSSQELALELKNIFEEKLCHSH